MELHLDQGDPAHEAPLCHTWPDAQNFDGESPDSYPQYLIVQIMIGIGSSNRLPGRANFNLLITP